MEKSFFLQTLKRNIRYWGRLTEQLVGIIVLACVIYGGFMSLSLDNGDFWENIVSYMVMMAIIFLDVVQMNYATAYIPLALSFGARRRETLWGVQWMNLLVFVQIMVLIICAEGIHAGSLLPGLDFGRKILGLILMALAMGQFGNAMALKWGGKARVIFVILYVLLFVVLGFVWAVSMEISGSPAWIWTACVASGVVLYAISIYTLYRALRNYEVRR